MIEKYCHIPAFDPIHGQNVFILPTNDIFEKTASIIKQAQVSDEIAQAIDGLTPEPGHRYVLVNGIGSGEFWSCFPAGAKILMADGSQRDIEDVLPGDKVVTHKNRARKVLGVTRGRHARGLTRVEFSSTVNVLRATHEHPVLVIPRDEWVSKRQAVFTKRKGRGLSYAEAKRKFLQSLKPVWMNISEMRRGDRVMMPLETRTKAFGDLKDNARLFGYYLSEGCSASTRKHYKPTGKRYVYPDRQMVFVTASGELEIHKEIVEAGERLGRKTQTRYVTQKSSAMDNSENNACRQNLMHAETAQAAVLHMGKGSSSKFLSQDIMKMPRGWQHEFLGAYLNGDGCQVNASDGRYDGTICASTASRKLATGLQSMLWRLGIRASVYKGMQRGSVSHGNDIYEIDIPRFQAGTLRPHTNFSEKIDPEKTTAMIDLDEGFAYVPVRNVTEEEFEGTVYNLEVEEDNSYVAEGVAVHNSNKNGDYFPELGLSKKGSEYGYETFMQGHNFIHHQNKDPQKAVGTIKVSHYNPRMHRCELVLNTDMERLAKADPAIYEKVANGEPVDVSMGSKCDFDVCSICSNRASNRSEYCFPGDTHVLDELGRMRFIRDVRPGDNVLTHYGRPMKVLEVSERAIEENVVELDLYGHSSFPLRVTSEHRMLVVGKGQILGCRGVSGKSKSRYGSVRHKGEFCKYCKKTSPLELTWMAARDIAPDDYLAVPIPREEREEAFGFSEKALLALGRLLGYYIAEGHVAASKGVAHTKGFALAFHEDETNLIDDVRRCVSELGRDASECVTLRGQGQAGRMKQVDGSVKVYERVRCVSVHVRDSHLSCLMKKLAGTGSRTKVLSSEVMWWPKSVQREVITGWILGDGSKDMNPMRGTIRSATSSSYLASQMRILMMRCGASPSVHLYRRTSNIAYQEIFYVNLQNRQQDLFPGLRLRWEPVQNKAKNQRLFQYKGYMMVPVRSVKHPWLTGKVYNLEVDGDHTYTANFMAAHNCNHLKTAMNQILDDGRKVYAYTPHPRFFDMSYVTKGADVTAKALHYLSKAASEHTRPGTGPGRTVTCPDPSLHETAECEPSYTHPYFTPDKLAAVTILEVMEPRISSETLDEMAKVGFHEALSTCSHLGIVLKPEEYQRLALVCLGEKEAADKAEAAGAVIDPSEHSWFDPEIKTINKQTDPSRFSPKVASLVCDHIESRTVFEPYFSKRLEKAAYIPAKTFAKIAEQESFEKDAAGFMTPEIAAALALGYVVYRKGIPKSDIEAVRKALHDPKMAKKVVAILIPLIAAGSVIDHMLGFTPPTGTVKSAGIGAEVVLPVAGAYLYSAYARRKAERGKRVSGLEHMFIDYPLPMAIGGVAGVAALKRKFGRTLGKSSGIISDVERRAPEMEKDAVLGGMMYALGSGIYRPRASGAIGYAADEAILSALGMTAAGLKNLVSGKTKVQD